MRFSVRKRKGCLISFVVVGIVSFFVSYRWVDFPFASYGLDKEWARAQKNGIPLTSDELKPNPPVDPDQNAGLRLQAIAKEVTELVRKDDLAKGSDRLLHADPYLPRKEMDRLKVIEPYLPRVLETLKKPGYWVDRDYDIGSELEYPEFSGYEEIGEAFATKAKIAAKQGDLSTTIIDLQVCFRLAKLIGLEPTVRGQNVANGLFWRATFTIEKVAGVFQSSPGALKKLRLSVLEPSMPPQGIKQAFKNEALMTIAYLRNPQRMRDTLASNTTPKPGLNQPIIRRGLPKGIILRACATKCLLCYNELLESQEWKDEDWVAISERAKCILEAHSFWRTNQLSDWEVDTQFIHWYDFPRVVFTDSQKQVMVSLLKVLEYHAVNHRFPRTLRAVGVDSSDPYLKIARLHYKTDGKSARVWSVGRNKVDDGGDPNKSRDVVAMYPARKQ